MYNFAQNVITVIIWSVCQATGLAAIYIITLYTSPVKVYFIKAYICMPQRAARNAHRAFSDPTHPKPGNTGLRPANAAPPGRPQRRRKKAAPPKLAAPYMCRAKVSAGKRLIHIRFYFVCTPEDIIRACFVQDCQLHNALDRDTAVAAFKRGVGARRYVQIFGHLILRHFMAFA